MSDGPAVVVANEAGTNVAEVKAASTAAVAGDKALVVAVSPNNTVAVSAASLPLPSGAATAANQTTLGNQTTKINDGTNTATVTGANALKVDGSAVTQPVSDAGGSLTVDGTVAVSNLSTAAADANNSSTATLGGGATFTGTSTDVLGYSHVLIAVSTDKNGTLFADFSTDASNWEHTVTVPITASVPFDIAVSPNARYYRVRLTNTAGTAQTYLRLASYLKPGAQTGDVMHADQTIDGSDSVQLTKGIVVGKTTGGGGAYVDVKVTPSGALTTESTIAGSLPAGNNNIGDVDVASVPAPLSTTGGGTEATALRVTIANDSTGVVSVDDNGGSLTVDGTVTANVGTTGGLALDATLSAQSLVDNTVFTDGSSRVVPSGFVYDETSGPALAENDIAAARVDDKRAQVHVIEDATTRGQRMVVTAAGAAKVDGSAVTQPVSAASLPLPTGAATSANQTTLGSQTTKINDGTNTATVTGANALKVDGSAVTQPVSGTVTANVGTTGGLALDATLSAQSLVDNTAFTDGSSRVVPAGFVFDETSGPALAENDIAAARVDDKRAQVIAVEDATTRGQRLTITAANAAKVDGSAVTQPISAVSLPLPTGAATAANQTTLGNQTTKINDGTNTAAVKAASTPATAADPALVVAVSPNNSVAVTDNSGSLTVDTPQLPAALVGGRLDQNVGAWLGSTAPTVGQKTLSASIPVALASDQDNATATNQATQITSLQLLDDLPHGMNAAFNKGVAIGGQLDDSSTTVATEDNIAPVRITAQRSLHVNLRNTSGDSFGTVSRPIASEPTGGRTTVHSAATVTSSGSQFLTWQGWSEWYLIINLKDAPTGTTPTIQYKIEEVEPLDQTTVVGQTITGVVHTTAGIEVLEIVDTVTDSFRISWTVTGAGASWTNVNVTWMGHAGGNAVEGQAEEGQPLTDAPLPVAGVDAGNLVRTLKLDNQGRLIVVTTGATTKGFSFGDVALSSVTTAVVRRTTYTEQTSNAQRSLVSANVNDTSAGTGARQVKITYFTATNTGPFTETVTMNGTTAVNTVATDICYIERLDVVTVGSGGVNAGIITLRAATGGGGAVVWTIGAGDNRTFGAHHYVPTGKTCNITGLSAGINGGAASFFIRSLILGVANQPESQISDVILMRAQSATTPRLYPTPIPVVGPARLQAFVTTESNTSLTYRASFDFYEE